MNNETTSQSTPELLRRYQSLLEMAEAIAAQRDLPSLFNDLSKRLSPVLPFDGVIVLLYDEERDLMREYLLQSRLAHDINIPRELPAAGTPGGWVCHTQEPMFVADAARETQFAEINGMVAANGVKSYCLLPLTSAGRRLGALGFASLQEAVYHEADRDFLMLVARQVAVALDNALNFESAEDARQRFARERDRLKLLLEVNNAVVAHLDLEELMAAVSASLRQVVAHDVSGIALYDPASNQLRAHVLSGDRESAPYFARGVPIPFAGTAGGEAFTTGQPVFVKKPDHARFHSDYARKIYEAGIRSGGSIPLIAHGRKLGVLGVGSKRNDAFTPDDIELLCQVAHQIAIAVENSLLFENARTAQQHLERERDRTQLLLEINNAVVTSLDLRELLNTISPCLRQVIHHDFAAVLLYESESRHLRAHALDFPEHVMMKGAVFPVEGTPSGLAFTTRRPFLVTPRELEKFGATPLIKMLRAEGVQSGCSLPLLSHDRALGVLTLMSRRADGFTEEDVPLLAQIAGQIAIAVENALNYERALSAEQQLQKRLEHLRLLLEINNAVVAQLDLHELVRVTAACLREVLHYEIAGLSLYDPEINQLRAYAYDFPDPQFSIAEGTPIPLEGSLGGIAFTSGQPFFINRPGAEEGAEGIVSDFNKRFVELGVKSGGCVPLIVHGRKLGVLGVASFREDAFLEEHQELLGQIASQIAIAVDNSLNFERARKAEQEAKRHSDRLGLVLRINNAVVSQLELEELLRVVSGSLREELHHDTTGVALYDAESNKLRVVMTDFPAQMELVAESYLVPLEGSVMGLAFTSGEPVFLDEFDLERFPSDFTRRSYEAGLRSCANVPLIAHGRKLGALGVASRRPSAFSAADIELLCQSAKQIAIAVENALNFERARAAEEAAKRESERRQLLLEINNAVVTQLDLHSLVKTVSACLQKLSHHDIVGMALYDPEINQLRAYATNLPDNEAFWKEGQPIPLAGSLSGVAFTRGEPVFPARIDDERFQSDFSKRFRAAGFKSGGAVPLIAHGRKLGALGVASYSEVDFSADEIELLCQVASQVAIAVDNALAYREIETLKNKLTEEKLYLEEEINTAYNFEEIIGRSPALTRLLKQVETVAPTDSTVLIQGETGTGKELLARALHALSARRERTLVKINCAAIPIGLIESELFGHERGAFTGAIAQRIGRFELAHKGTLFLDEIGEIPLELQPKLLRVLQEQEFERLGSTRTQQVDVRLVAATNRDLAQMTAENRFRSDLYYRLNVFPITIPPLRERPEDIPLLVRFFAQKFAQRMKKRIETIPAEAVAALQQYHWPGNIRELENLIERAVILTPGAELQISLSEIKLTAKPASNVTTVAIPAATIPATTIPANVSSDDSLEAIERDHILRVLRETDWTVGGPEGAAAKLGMKRTTLQSRMKKLGIRRQN